MLTFLLSNAIRGIGQRDYQSWKSNAEYKIGDIVVSERNKYVAMSNGRSGRVRPIHTADQVSDGGVFWLFVETLSSSDSITEAVYLHLKGQTSYFKKLSATMFSAAVKYKPWSDGMKVESGDIVLADDSVFVCVEGGTSTVKPINKTRYNVQTADLVVWRYCGDIEKETKRFVTAKHIPIRTNATKSTDVQWRARVVTQSGNLTGTTMPTGIQFTVTPQGEVVRPWVTEQTNNDTVVVGQTSGTGYELTTTVKNGSVDIKVKKAGKGIDPTDSVVIVGDGTGASATITVDTNGAITNITVVGGTGYTKAEAYIVKQAHAVITIDRIAVAPWEVLNNGNADALVMNTRIDSIPGKLDDRFRYDTIELVSTSLGKERHETELDQYNVLYTTSITPKQRTENQEESVTLEFNFGD